MSRLTKHLIGLVILTAAVLAGAPAAVAQQAAPAFTAQILLSNDTGLSAEVGDMDGDGDLDVVVSGTIDNFGAGELLWLESNGLDIVAEHLVFSAESTPSKLNLADLDGDGDLDVVWRQLSEGVFKWAENINSGGQFVVRTFESDPQIASFARTIEVTDIDGDGDIDLVTGVQINTSTGRLQWLENDGGNPPSFTPITVDTGSNGLGWSLTASDIDMDGDIDIAALSPLDDLILWYENSGGPTPGFVKRVIASVSGLPADGGSPNVITAGDVDGDGKIDIVVGFSADGQVRWYRNDGASPPAFTEMSAFEAETSVARVFDLLAEDLDLDGDTDLAFVTENDGAMRILWNDGADPPGFSVEVVTTAAFGPRDLARGDMDGDGDPDIVLASNGDRQVVWHRNNHNIWPRVVFEEHFVDQPAGPRLAPPADLDGDGDADLVNVNFTDLTWYENRLDEAGVFTPRIIENGLLFITADAGDFDGDGDVDVLSGSAGLGVRLHLSDGGNPPTPPQFTSLTVLNPDDIGAANPGSSLADLNGDGLTDVVTTVNSKTAGPTLHWQRNDGGDPPSFTNIPIPTPTPAILQPTPADFDGDGDVDLIVFHDDGLWLHVNDGAADPAFEPQRVNAVTFMAAVPLAADLDGDGDLDIAAGGPDELIYWEENLGGDPLAFVHHEVWPKTNSAGDVFEVAVADVDGDGDLDLAAAVFMSLNIVGDPIRWFENLGGDPPRFIMHAVSTAPLEGWSVEAADLDGDGRTDLVGRLCSSLRWFENLYSIPADLNDDGVVNGADLAALLAGWGVDQGSGADLNGDGVVNGADLAQLLTNWTGSNP